METEKATSVLDLPHRAEPVSLTHCVCDRELSNVLHGPRKIETASEQVTLVTEKGI